MDRFGGILNKDYRELFGLSDEGARKDLNRLVEKNILSLKGKGRSAHYILKQVGDWVHSFISSDVINERNKLWHSLR